MEVTHLSSWLCGFLFLNDASENTESSKNANRYIFIVIVVVSIRRKVLVKSHQEDNIIVNLIFLLYYGRKSYFEMLYVM